MPGLCGGERESMVGAGAHFPGLLAVTPVTVLLSLSANLSDLGQTPTAGPARSQWGIDRVAELWE